MRIDVENGYWKIMVRTHESSGDQPVSLRFFLPSSLSPSSFFLHSPSSRPYLKIFRIFCRNSARRLERLRQKWKKQSVIRSQHSDFGNSVHFAAFKNHIGLYPTSSGISAFKKELSQYEGL